MIYIFAFMYKYNDVCLYTLLEIYEFGISSF